MAWEDSLKEIEKFNGFANDLLSNQPPACELDASSAWIADLNAILARYAQIWGVAEGMYNLMIARVIDKMDDESYKKIKNSSTLTNSYVKGKYPKFTAAYEELKKLGTIFQMVNDNTRTLISAYKAEIEAGLNGRVRQTAQN